MPISSFVSGAYGGDIVVGNYCFVRNRSNNPACLVTMAGSDAITNVVIANRSFAAGDAATQAANYVDEAAHALTSLGDVDLAKALNLRFDGSPAGGSAAITKWLLDCRK